MLRTGILNPAILSLRARIRHTNTIVIADRGFPFWPQIETSDISLVEDVPTVQQVFAALTTEFVVGSIWMAEEFRKVNASDRVETYLAKFPPVTFEPHIEFKRRVPSAIGLIRTGDSTPYANMILESA